MREARVRFEIARPSSRLDVHDLYQIINFKSNHQSEMLVKRADHGTRNNE
jgi:hypothetical protein